MSIAKNHIVVKEFDCIYKSNQVHNASIATIQESDFNSLIAFILDNSDTSDIAMTYFRKKGKDVIRFNNYVGVIETKSGFTIEILPKVYHDGDIQEQRKIFLSMLRYLKDSPFRTISEAHLRTKRFPIFEIFISSFLSEIDTLYKKGLKRAYTEKKENLDCAKGRIDFPNQIAHNIVHKEKFYVHYDEFSLNIPQNRLLKNTFHYLLSRSRLYKNKVRLHQYLQIWDSIPFSKNIEADLQQINAHNRLYSHYERPLQWAKIFLKGESFTNFKGKSLNTALLFPMERIFEDYVAAMSRKYLPNNELTLHTQDKRKHLVSEHKGKAKFKLKPDIVVEKNGNPIAILDTKWKAVNENLENKNYWISSSDMYQLHAYGKKYPNNPKLFLIYPASDTFKNELKPFIYEENELELIAKPFYLSRNRSMIKEFITSIYNEIGEHKISSSYSP
jgi:5-methylcytosine-specific restriction enzyme subunit McrC